MSSYELWQRELNDPMPIERRGDRTTNPTEMTGFFRIEAARTRHDFPVAIWTPEPKDGEPSATTFQIGARRMNTATNAAEWDQFCATTWLKCRAVRKAEWSVALETGIWTSDGKAARAMPEDEKLGVGTEQSGGNNAPIEEELADQIKALAETIDATPDPDSQQESDALSGSLDRMRVLLKKAGDLREERYRPHKSAADEVSVAFDAIMDPGQQAGIRGEAKRKKFLKKEQARLDAEAEAENERRRKDAEAARIQADREARAKGVEPPQAGTIKPEIVEPKRATSGTAFGRKTGLKKVTVGVIDDLPQLCSWLIHSDHPDAEFMEWVQARVDRAAKAGNPLPGTHAQEDMR